MKVSRLKFSKSRMDRGMDMKGKNPNISIKNNIQVPFFHWNKLWSIYNNIWKYLIKTIKNGDAIEKTKNGVKSSIFSLYVLKWICPITHIISNRGSLVCKGSVTYEGWVDLFQSLKPVFVIENFLNSYPTNYTSE